MVKQNESDADDIEELLEDHSIELTTEESNTFNSKKKLKKKKTSQVL